ncbi:hypothetical protein BJ123_1316 [Rhodopseudomonas thermotolerans]|uniref:Uncharacterized protein n=2 Tax=Rhodopseudomonas TaxID=1073 RepID=A0A336JU52_9BRAD|nr:MULTISPECIES: hypothetical protein [Rhodopseudomonas]RED25538.1 hypothetical protein BJ125_1316 [Rhodopseudomonas pentothenatexigens]REF90368.1 hypothetical protein BJ123_1316 [Rhodopseudomonas thermotolerans]SSW93150.1 hypothetical protein SAMN05892882_1316 [Rhodopseudomonas pentothenatexigens]
MTDTVVNASTRVVAAGLVEGSERLRLTVSFMPTRAKGEDGVAGVNLESWPSGIEGLLCGPSESSALHYFVEPIPRTLPGRPAAPSRCVPVALARARPQTLNELGATIDDLWRSVCDHMANAMTDKDRFWQELGELFDESSAGADKYHRQVDGKSVPNVLPTGRADSAILHVLARARRAARTVVEGGVRTTIDTASTSKVTPWPDKFYRSAGKDAAEKERACRLSDERKRLEEAAEKYAGDCRKAAASIAASKEANLTTSGRSAATAALLSPGSVGTCGPSCEDLFDEGKYESLLARARALHQVAMLPDDTTTAPKDRPPGALAQADNEKLQDRCQIDTTTYPGHFARVLMTLVKSYPALARVFRFSVDVDIDIDPATLAQAWRDDDHGNEAAFLMLAARVPAGDDTKRVEKCVSKCVFTLAKLTRRKSDQQFLAFHPVTREEVELRLEGCTTQKIRASGSVSQIGGVVDLGQRTTKSAGPFCGDHARYEIINIDPVLATEAGLREAQKQQSVADNAARTATEVASARKAFAREIETGIVSRGMVLVDRWRSAAVIGEMTTARLFADVKTPLRLLDADDLTIGYRLDVMARSADDRANRWRSLMDREIDYRDPRPERDEKDLFGKCFDALGLKYGSDLRRDLDAAMMMPTARRRLLAGGQQMVHVEECIAGWEGDPLSLTCKREEIEVKRGTEIAITRLFDLPSTATEATRKAWPLRYGWAYRFGMRPVWVGGVAVPLERAAAVYDARGPLGDVTMPVTSGRDGAPRAGWRRFLRQEAVLPPIALLPKGIAGETTFMCRQSAVTCILRTSVIEQRRKTEQTWRVFLPPQVSLDEAMRHGVFDDIRNKEYPDGALANIDYDQPIPTQRLLKNGLRAPEGKEPPRIGFPQFGRVPVRQDGKVVFPASDQPLEQLTPSHFAIVSPAEGTGRDSSDASDVFGGEPVFRIKARSGVAERKRQQFYPDPMARQLVLAVRRAGEPVGTGYFEGAPRVIDLSGSPYEQVKPVALVVERHTDSGLRVGEPKQEDFWAGKDEDRFIGDSAEMKGDGPKCLVRVATLVLKPGEAVELDAWYIPTEALLRAYFDLPETLAVIAAASRNAPGQDILAALNRHLTSKEEKPFAFSAGEKAKLRQQAAWVGHSGITVDPVGVAAAAEILYRFISRRPLPELSCVRTLSLLHAVDRPQRAPKFAGDDAVSRLRAYRCKSDTPARLEKLKQIASEKNLPPPHGQEGDDGIVFSGKVRFDRDGCRQLELVARCISMERSAIDDTRLGRTNQQRLTGEWPERVAVEPSKDGEHRQDGAAKEFISRKARYLFGFDVDSAGRVRLPKETVPILQIEDLQQRGKESSYLAGLETVDLVEAQIASLESNNREKMRGALRTLAGDSIAGQLARKMEVHLRAASRFDTYFRQVVPTKESPVPESVFPADPYAVDKIKVTSIDPRGAIRSGDHADTAPKPGSDQLQTIWIPATVRPTRPKVHAALPSYTIDCETDVSKNVIGQSGPPKPIRISSLARRSQVRIFLDRPWFSSGEGERLGLVLWPPHLLEVSQDPENLQAGRVPRHVLYENRPDLSTAMDLATFVDEDLGPGGAFTTRWGADPIRESAGPIGPFLTWQCLIGDAKGTGAATDGAARRGPASGTPESDFDSDSPVYVPKVAIPLRDPREQKSGERADAAAIEPTMTAALLTYVPRFDVETEKWFVDVELKPDRMVEPFVRFGLVRFQPNADPRVQVSAPVTVWAQLYPRRDLQVWKEGRNLEVQVSGYSAQRASGSLRGNRTQGLMRISVLELSKSASGHAVETVAPMVDGNVRKAAVRLVERDAKPAPYFAAVGDATWRAAFALATGPEAPSRLAVVVEELDEYASTEDEDAAPPPPAPEQKAKPEPQRGLEPPVGVTNGGRAPTSNAQQNRLALEPIVAAGQPAPPGVVRSGPRFLARVEYENLSSP